MRHGHNYNNKEYNSLRRFALNIRAIKAKIEKKELIAWLKL